MIWHLEVLLLDTLDSLHQALKLPPAPFFHVGFLALLYGNQEIWIIFHCSFECAAVLLQEVIVDPGTTTWDFFILYSGAMHVAEPSGLLSTRVIARKAHGLVNGVSEARGLQLFILGSCFAWTQCRNVNCFGPMWSE